MIFLPGFRNGIQLPLRRRESIGWSGLQSEKVRLAGIRAGSRISAMSSAAKSDAVRFTTKGQVAIPMWLRKQFHIEDGTKAIVEATPEGILLKPVTCWAIEKGHGLLKRERKPGDKSFAEEWAEHKREELELEEAKYARSTGSR
jgi:AbrB family looped-hinge helix DNA binding protein